IERAYNQVFLSRQPALGRPGPGQVLVEMIACSLCGTDVKVLSGGKVQNVASSGVTHHVILGHEGVGRVLEVGHVVVGLVKGQLWSSKPHYFKPAHDATCRSSRRDRGPSCIGYPCTVHGGWDKDGCFADRILVPSVNLAPVPDTALNAVAE